MATNVMKTRGKKKDYTAEIIMGILFLLIDIYAIMHYSIIMYLHPKTQLLDAVNMAQSSMGKPDIVFTYIFNKEVLSIFAKAHLYAIPVYFFLFLLYISSSKKRDPFRGMEHGSADFAKDKTRKFFINFVGSLIIQTNLYINPVSKAHRKFNLNRLVIGGSGAGKSRYEIKPNIMQLNGSYIITDPKGELYRDCAYLLEQNGYKVRVLNLIDPKYSNTYNPLYYIREEKDVLILVDTIQNNTRGKGEKEDFWTQAAKALLTAIIFYLCTLDLEYRHMHNILKLLTSAKVSEDGENDDNPLDKVFDKLRKDIEEDNDENGYKALAVLNYDTFKLGAGKTAKSILITMAVKLGIWSIKGITRLTGTDEMEINKIGYEKTAVFIIIPDSYSTFNVIASMFYSQLFQILYYEADFNCGGRLPLLVQCLCDEFANIGQIPEFEKKISTMRSRNISVVPVIQGLSQLKDLYKESWQTILGNCDTLHFLGTTDEESLKYISGKLGKTTVRVDTRGRSKGKSGGYSEGESYTARDLMTTNELFEMPKEDSIVFIKGYKPFYGQKFDIEKHPNYKMVQEYPTDIKTKFTLSNEVKYKIYKITDFVEVETNSPEIETDIEIDDGELNQEELKKQIEASFNME